MKNVVYLLLIIFISANPLFSQKVRIEKVHDTNLFELEDGTLIKLAGVDAPSINHLDSTLKDLTEEIISFAKMKLLYGLVDVQYSDSITTGEIYRHVYLSRGNFLYNVDYNELYLSNGYGKFFENVDSVHSDIYREVERDARENYEGIWNFKWISQIDTLDTGFIPLNKLFPEDQPKYIYDRSAGRIILEIVAGPVVGFVTAIPGVWIATGFGAAKGWDAIGNGMLGFTIGYIAGNSIGVFMVAQGGNKDLSFWYTLASGIVGTAVGGGLAYLMEKTDYGWIPAMAGITLGPVIYANLIAPAPENNEEHYSLVTPNFMGPFSHKDMYNSTLILQQELFRINF